MSRFSRLASAGVTVAALAAIAGSIALAQPPRDAKPAQPPAQPDMQLPPGMTQEMMQACMEAGTPGPHHAYLGKLAGVWTGKTTMWMTLGAEPMVSECTATYAPIMDGRYLRCEITGDMPGMGPFNGFALYGFDNVGQKFQSTWIDNMGTGMMTGTGELASDGSTLNWKFTYNCPIQKKAVVMREIERRTGADSFTLEMFGPDPVSGKEYKCMEIAFTRSSARAAEAGTR